MEEKCEKKDMDYNNQPVIKGKRGKGAFFWFSIGFGSFFFLCCLFLIILIVGFFSVSNAIVSKDIVSGKRGLVETFVAGKGEDKMVLVQIKGIISEKSLDSQFFNTPGTVEVVKQSLEQASGDGQVKAVLFEIDSPGGEITASDVIYNDIINFKQDTGKKVVAYMGDVAASGGYYVSVAADKIIAHPTTITGSIGVIMPLINLAGLINKYGIKDNSIKSGLMKDIGSPLKEMLPEEKDVLSETVREMYMRFVTIISNGRHLPIDQVERIADGRIYTGNQALGLGLIDQIGYFEDAINLAKELAGLKDAKIIRYQQRISIGDMFRIMISRIFVNPEITIKVEELLTGNFSRPMYLWTGYRID